jgi:hypothetical protein
MLMMIGYGLQLHIQAQDSIGEVSASLSGAITNKNITVLSEYTGCKAVLQNVAHVFNFSEFSMQDDNNSTCMDSMIEIVYPIFVSIYSCCNSELTVFV